MVQHSFAAQKFFQEPVFDSRVASQPSSQRQRANLKKTSGGALRALLRWVTVAFVLQPAFFLLELQPALKGLVAGASASSHLPLRQSTQQNSWVAGWLRHFHMM
jgi:hypothetical protein